MSSVQCIHGFRTEHCASCHLCPHGNTASACVRCRATSRAPARAAQQPAVEAQASAQHAGFEIFYVPAVNGWRYRAPDSAPSRLSYRSAFLARKAVDRLAVASNAKRSSKAGK